MQAIPVLVGMRAVNRQHPPPLREAGRQPKELSRWFSRGRRRRR